MAASADSGQSQVLDQATIIARSKAVRRTLLRPTLAARAHHWTPLSPSLKGDFGQKQSGTDPGKTAAYTHGKTAALVPSRLVGGSSSGMVAIGTAADLIFMVD